MGETCRTLRRSVKKILVMKENTWKIRCRLEDNIKVDLQEARRGMDWIALSQYRDRWLELVNVEMNFWVP
jgi:hypothetical protein